MGEDYLVEFVTALIAQNRFALENHVGLTFEQRTDIRHALEDLKRADMYFMGQEFDEILNNYHVEATDGHVETLAPEDYPNLLDEPYPVRFYDNVPFDAQTRPPSNLCFIVIDCLHRWIPEDRLEFYAEQGIHGRVKVGFLCRQSENGEVDVRELSEFSYPSTVGSFTPNGKIRFAERHTLEQRDATGQDFVNIGGAFSLINQPRFVTKEAAGTRQQRKSARRTEDIAVEAWHRIVWDIDKPVHSKEKGSRNFNMPYHYTRGHYRKAQPHYKNAEFVYDGWHQWIDGFFSGHPAYGIKKGYHKPMIGAVA